MVSVAAKQGSRRRTEPKEKRKAQLIRATIRSIARRGLPDTTMATVSREAGLSQGIVNLHFKSKDRLMVETLAYVVDEYRSTWERHLRRAGESSAERLAALLDVDFDPAICNRNKLAVWFAFWGESRSRPTYRRLCREQDRLYRKTLADLCDDIIREGDYAGLDPMVVATGLSAMNEGLWLDILLSPRSVNRRSARDICHAQLASVFPRHFRDPRRDAPDGDRQ
jgi:TetR/AcrR family transcriptional repressor of bet genes